MPKLHKLRLFICPEFHRIPTLGFGFKEQREWLDTLENICPSLELVTFTKFNFWQRRKGAGGYLWTFVEQHVAQEWSNK